MESLDERLIRLVTEDETWTVSDAYNYLVSAVEADVISSGHANDIMCDIVYRVEHDEIEEEAHRRLGHLIPEDDDGDALIELQETEIFGATKDAIAREIVKRRHLVKRR